MSKMAVNVSFKQKIKLERNNFPRYVDEIRERFENELGTMIYLSDIVAQAHLDGDLPELDDVDYDVLEDESFSPEEIEEIAAS